MRKGTIVNPIKEKGTIVNPIKEKGTIVNPIKKGTIVNRACNVLNLKLVFKGL